MVKSQYGLGQKAVRSSVYHKGVSVWPRKMFVLDSQENEHDITIAVIEHKMLPTQLCIHSEIMGYDCYVTFNGLFKPLRHLNMICSKPTRVHQVIRSLDKDSIHKHPN